MENQGEGYSCAKIPVKRTQFIFSQTVAMYGNPHVLLRGTDYHKCLLIKSYVEQTKVSGGQGLPEMWSRLVGVLWLCSFSPFRFLK